MRSVKTPLLVISSATLRTTRKPHGQERSRARTSSSEWLHVRNTKCPCAQAEWRPEKEIGDGEWDESESHAGRRNSSLGRAQKRCSMHLRTENCRDVAKISVNPRCAQLLGISSLQLTPILPAFIAFRPSTMAVLPSLNCCDRGFCRHSGARSCHCKAFRQGQASAPPSPTPRAPPEFSARMQKSTADSENTA